MKLRQLRSKFIRIEIRDPEIEMIDSSGRTFALLDTKERRPYTEDMDSFRLLPKRHSEKLLIELRGTMEVRNPHGDVVQIDGAKACRLVLGRECARSGDRSGG